MFKKTIHFIQYNNLTVFIILGFFLVGSSVLAQTETGQEIIGTKNISREGVDNTLLLEANLDNLQMDYNIENIEQDEKYYYVTYTFINLEKIDQAWQYQMREKKRKVSRKLRMDLGKYLAEELKEEYQARIKTLREEQELAQTEGETQITEVEEYSGLIGKTLGMASNVFEGYNPVKRKKLPSPSVPILLTMPRDSVDDSYVYESIDDDLEDVYADYVAENDPDGDNIFGVMDNCPNIANEDQMDIDEDGMGNACDPHPESYDEPSDDIIEDEEMASSTIDTASSSDNIIDDNASSSEDVVEDDNATSSEDVIDNNASSSEDVITDSNEEQEEPSSEEGSDESESDGVSVEEEVEPDVEIIELLNNNDDNSSIEDDGDMATSTENISVDSSASSTETVNDTE